MGAPVDVRQAAGGGESTSILSDTWTRASTQNEGIVKHVERLEQL